MQRHGDRVAFTLPRRIGQAGRGSQIGVGILLLVGALMTFGGGRSLLEGTGDAPEVAVVALVIGALMLVGAWIWLGVAGAHRGQRARHLLRRAHRTVRSPSRLSTRHASSTARRQAIRRAPARQLRRCCVVAGVARARCFANANGALLPPAPAARTRRSARRRDRVRLQARVRRWRRSRRVPRAGRRRRCVDRCAAAGRGDGRDRR